MNYQTVISLVTLAFSLAAIAFNWLAYRASRHHVDSK